MFKMWILIITVFFILVMCSIDDLYYKRINILSVLFLTVTGLITNKQFSLQGAIPGFLLFMIAILLKESGIGTGDGILLMCLGILIGFKDILFTSTIALLIAFIYGVSAILIFRKKLRYEYPFIPFVLVGYMICMYKKLYKNGSLTIEMSLLMPAILAIIILIIFTCYYLHDKCVIKRASYSACIGVNESKDDFNSDLYKMADSEYIEKAEKDFDEKITGRTLGKWELNRSAYIEDGKIALEVSGKMEFPGLFSEYVSSIAYITKQKTYAYFTNEAEYMNEHRN